VSQAVKAIVEPIRQRVTRSAFIVEILILNVKEIFSSKRIREDKLDQKVSLYNPDLELE